ncbi:hybrid sensor histidine kinase/response regulator [Lysobacter psychrotolerans]|uniref:histidine kinase n=2 Tax=Montanilutibacter psychrotolerans TaxID=1327343 RepID=A0A3M8T4X9_9GAMM|nr:hybrid sensor histidine kinase/response regulator [Lysobacter psychrotolerans]
MLVIGAGTARQVATSAADFSIAPALPRTGAAAQPAASTRHAPAPPAPAHRAGIPESPRVRAVGVAEGLPSSTVTGMAFDHSGYLWVATVDGLARYDGISVRVWRHVPGDAASLPGNYVEDVHVDAQDRVWASVEGRGLSVLDPQRRGFRHYSKATVAQIGSDDVWAITSRGDEIWFGTFGGGLYRIAGDGRVSRFMPDPRDPHSLPSDTVLSLAFDPTGDLWIGTRAGLARWNGRTFDRLELPGESSAPMVYSVTPQGSALWVGARTGVFRREDDGRWTNPPWSAMFEAPNAVFDVAPDGAGQYWLGSQRNLWHVVPGESPLPVTSGRQGPARAVTQVLRQKDGALWFPLAGRGLGYLRADWRRVAQFSRAQGELIGELYRAVTPSLHGGWWVVGARGEVERIDRDGRVLAINEVLREQLSEYKPLSAVEDRQGRLWLGGSNLLRRIDGNQLRTWNGDSGADAPPDGAIVLFAIAPDGSLWLSSAGAGLQRRDPDSGRVLKVIQSGPEQGLGVGDLEAMRFDRDGRLWIAGDNGLAVWNPSADRFEQAVGITGDRVFGFDFDGADGLWLQRLSGLERYRRDGARWRRTARASIEEGIPAVEGSGLHVDRHGRVWLATLRGLFRWDPQQRRLRRFGLADGFSSQEFVDHSTTLDGHGVLGAGLEDGGVVLVDTLAPDLPAQTPKLQVEPVEVRRHGRWLELPGRADAQAADAWPTLAPNDRELRLQLRLLAFEDPGSNLYFSRLEGYDADWVAHGGNGDRVFAGLPAGNYVLRARAVDAARNPAIERVLRFRVQPPWWRTRWAYAGAIALVLLVAWWIASAWRARLRRRNAQLRAEHEREVAEHASQAKTQFLATLGHEVRTPMTGVLGMSELLLATPLDQRQRGYAEAIHGAGGHLLRLVNDALDLARVEAGKLALGDEPFDLRRLVDEVAALMAPLARRRGLTFDLHVSDDAPHWVRGDSVRVRQVLLNLIGNGVKFTAQGRVWLGVQGLEPTGARFEIGDTGPGLNTEQQARLFRRFEQAEGARTSARYGGSGLGLAISQELAAAMAGTIAVDSTPGQGTRFIVALPLAPAEPAVDADAAAWPASTLHAHEETGGLDLLLVEDDATVAEVVIGLLQSLGHRVSHAAHGLAALSEVASGRHDIALLDLDLPGIDGFALARQLRSLGFTAPLVAITARADAEAEPLAMAAGFNHFVRKPVTAAMLARAIATVRAHDARALPSVDPDVAKDAL